ncbi:MAG TPA: bifunctional DNA-binding transcriptional regulator/O6-methylguanine-DNA methyltransferase Ada [Terriglobales bacterium]|nr:bifunctional DNA-binding transcriptional regulator/O6-methylguanine-DNA methyltransferase Ada [Terriglobales bacterium]
MKAATAAARAASTAADPRWAAVVAHDPRADGRFCYSVATTGVYCRPSCGARRARPENVRFHVSAAAAEAAGFRPCLRCQPQCPAPPARHTVAIAAACRTLSQAEAPPALAELAANAGLSPFHFQRLFKQATGLTPRQFAAAQRDQRVREALRAGTGVTEAIYAAGYNSSGHFYATAQQALGMVPSRLRAGGERATLRYAVGAGSLGAVLVARSQRGVCAVFLGDDPAALARQLREQFPRAQLLPAGSGFARLVARVVALVEDPAAKLALPLDLQGTAFQLRVWRALRALPPGATLSYAALARRLGRPTAARAVAGACAANPLAVAVPCHRVVASDGALAGYRWGLARKQALLQRESHRASARK